MEEKMKKTKNLFVTIVGLMLAFVMSIAFVACSSGDSNDDEQIEIKEPNITIKPDETPKSAEELGITDSSEEKWALLYVEIVTPGKPQFDLGEEFSCEDLSVRAVFLNPDKQATVSDIEGNLERKVLTEEEYVVDYSEYNANKVGTYIIYVIYTFEDVTVIDNYSVTVRAIEPEIGGIVCELAEGKSNTYTLSGDYVDITKDIVVVYTMVDVDGKAQKSAEPVNSDLYDVQLYLGATLVDGNRATKTGAYSLVVTLKADASKQDFVTIYVVAENV